MTFQNAWPALDTNSAIVKSRPYRLNINEFKIDKSQKPYRPYVASLDPEQPDRNKSFLIHKRSEGTYSVLTVADLPISKEEKKSKTAIIQYLSLQLEYKKVIDMSEHEPKYLIVCKRLDRAAEATTSTAGGSSTSAQTNTVTRDQVARVGQVVNILPRIHSDRLT